MYDESRVFLYRFRGKDRKWKVVRKLTDGRLRCRLEDDEQEAVFDEQTVMFGEFRYTDQQDQGKRT